MTPCSAKPTCCARRPSDTRAYRCRCGARWHLTHGGWIRGGGRGAMPPPRLDSLTDALADDYASGDTLLTVMSRNGVGKSRVLRALAERGMRTRKPRPKHP